MERESSDLEGEGVAECSKTISFGCSLHYWGNVRLLLRGDANFSFEAWAHFCRAVISIGGEASVRTSF
jgi:hypothetical protein